MVDLKQEYYLTVDQTNPYISADTGTISGVPSDVHKIYLIEPVDTSASATHAGLLFKPLDYNHELVQGARARSNIEPKNDTVYYSITGQGAPTGAPTIYIAPKLSSAIAATALRIAYVPTLADKVAADNVPIPGEADNALIAWTIAFARAKEREGRSPDPEWLAVYATEKNNLLQSLGVRQLQEPVYVDAVFQPWW